MRKIKPKSELTCLHCDVEFERRSTRPIPKKIFCSVDCHVEYKNSLIFGSGMIRLFDNGKMLIDNRFSGRASFKKLYEKYISEENYKGLELRILFD